MTKPVVAYIAGVHRAGEDDGHAGAIISGSAGHRAGEEGRARGAWHPRRHDADGDRPAVAEPAVARAMQLSNRERDAEPFVTKDGSTIREYFHSDAAEPRRGVARARPRDAASLPRASEEIYLIVEGAESSRWTAIGAPCPRATRSSSRPARGTS